MESCERLPLYFFNTRWNMKFQTEIYTRIICTIFECNIFHQDFFNSSSYAVSQHKMNVDSHIKCLFTTLINVETVFISNFYVIKCKTLQFSIFVNAQEYLSLPICTCTLSLYMFIPTPGQNVCPYPDQHVWPYDLRKQLLFISYAHIVCVTISWSTCMTRRLLWPISPCRFLIIQNCLCEWRRLYPIVQSFSLRTYRVNRLAFIFPLCAPFQVNDALCLNPSPYIIGKKLAIM